MDAGDAHTFLDAVCYTWLELIDIDIGSVVERRELDAHEIVRRTAIDAHFAILFYKIG